MAPTSTPRRKSNHSTTNSGPRTTSAASEAHRGPRTVRVERRYRRTAMENPMFSVDSIIRGMEDTSINDNDNPAQDNIYHTNQNGKRVRKNNDASTSNMRLRVHVADRTQHGVPAPRRITLQMETTSEAPAPSAQDLEQAMTACRKTNDFLDEQEAIHQMIEQEQAAAASFFSNSGSEHSSTTASSEENSDDDDDDSTMVEDVTPPARNTQAFPTASDDTAATTPEEVPFGPHPAPPSTVNSFIDRINPFRSTGGIFTVATDFSNNAPPTRTSSFGSSGSENTDTTPPTASPPADLFFNARSSLNEPIGTDESNNRCLMCCDREITTVATPCGHMIACVECAERCHNKCPMCMQTCSFVRVFKGF